ncbi:MAG: hypothetical protein V2A57_01100 [Elusimicrobiota bacterium]
MAMKFVVKKAIAKVSFYDNTIIECNSLEELLKTVYEENDSKTARAVEIEGISEKGDICRAWFDFNNLVVQENKPVFLSNFRKQTQRKNKV